MTLTDVEMLRLFVDDPAGNDAVFTTPVLQGILEGANSDIDSAASIVWQMKAARVNEWYLSQTDGALLSRDQVFDHCMKMVEFYGNRSAGTFESVRMTTRDEDATSDL